MRATAAGGPGKPGPDQEPEPIPPDEQPTPPDIGPPEHPAPLPEPPEPKPIDRAEPGSVAGLR